MPFPAKSTLGSPFLGAAGAPLTMSRDGKSHFSGLLSSVRGTGLGCRVQQSVEGQSALAEG